MLDPRSFCHTRQNEVPGYRRFRKTSEYLMQSAAAHDVPDGLIRSLFPTEKGDLRLVVGEILLLRRPIPRLLLEFIGAEEEELRTLAAEDSLEFAEVVRREDLYPRYATVRYLAAVYKTLVLPAGLIEREAVDYLLSYTMKRRLRASITYSELKSLFIEPDGSVDTILYPPTITFTDHSLIPGATGYGEGRSHFV